MAKLLILADDFTGTLDSAVQLSKWGLRVKISADSALDFSCCSDFDVIAVDMESRHLSPEKAYQKIYTAVRRAAQYGIHFFYKKTDSALRGNIGSELTALSDAAGKKPVFFLPAHPDAQRYTIGGIQYIGDTPVSESIFSRDPFEPVGHSDIAFLIGEESPIPVRTLDTGQLASAASEDSQQIIVVNGKEGQDLENALHTLKQQKRRLFAGCAGFAAYLHHFFPGAQRTVCHPVKTDSLIVISGSLNEVTQKQIAYFQSCGARCYALTPAQKLTKRFFYSPEGNHFIRKLLSDVSAGIPIAVHTFDSRTDETKSVSMQYGITASGLRRLITDNIGDLTELLIQKHFNLTFVLIGGDSLYGFMKKHPEAEISLSGEISKDTVLLHMYLDGHFVQLVTKAGGLGTTAVLQEINHLCCKKEDMKIV